ncbi:MAG: hypothetical protein LiPW39_65, partial [Parcubacteria group bacterium LiPW_39]
LKEKAAEMEKARDAKEKTEATTAPTAPAARAAVKKPGITVMVPAGKLVHTGIYMREGQEAEFYQAAQRLYCLHGKRYNVPVRSKYWRDRWVVPGEIQLIGGPQATVVTIVQQ